MFTVSFIGSFCRLQHYASRRHRASLCVLSESLNYLLNQVIYSRYITGLTILQYYLLFSIVIFTHHSNTPSYYFVAVSRAERVHSRAGTVAAVQSVCLSGYKSMTACMLHYGFNRSIEWQVAVCASCLLSHSHIRDSTHTQFVSISDSLCLSCHLCCSLAGGLLFFLQRWASEDCGCQTVSSWDNLHALIPAHFVQWSCSLTFEWNFTYIQKGVN